jgi:AbrB family looped-hinge helix DNA binding protein
MALIEVTKSAEQKELRARTRLSDKGRLVIPAAMRAELGMVEGDMLILRVVDGELRIATREGRLRRAQEWIRQIVPPGVSLADELSAERREAAKYE